MTNDIELIELSPESGDGPEETLPAGRQLPGAMRWYATGRRWPSPRFAPRFQRRLGAGLVCALVAAVAVAVLVSRPAAPPTTPVAAASSPAPAPWPEAPPGPVPRERQVDPLQAYAPLDPVTLAALRAQVCAGGTCTYLPDSPRRLARYLSMFPDPDQTAGGSLIDADGTILGRGAVVTLASGVQYSLTVVLARGPALPLVTTNRRSDGGMVTLTARRGSWDLVSTITFQGHVAVRTGPARTWLASSTLPGAQLAGARPPA